MGVRGGGLSATIPPRTSSNNSRGLLDGARSNLTACASVARNARQRVRNPNDTVRPDMVAEVTDRRVVNEKESGSDRERNRKIACALLVARFGARTEPDRTGRERSCRRCDGRRNQPGGVSCIGTHHATPSTSHAANSGQARALVGVQLLNWSRHAARRAIAGAPTQAYL